MSGFLYQLHAKSQVADGKHFTVNGPWDTHGYVVSSKADGDQVLHLVRGTGRRDIRKGEIVLPAASVTGE